MGNQKIILSETEMKKLIIKMINENTEIKENFLNKIIDPLRNAYHGLKGLKSGHGIRYMKYTSELKNITRDLKKIDLPNEKIMLRLSFLYHQIENTVMRQDLKDELLELIKGAIDNFNSYKSHIDSLYNTVSSTLK